MATVRKFISLGVPAARAWDALRDWSAVHERVARGFVTATVVEDGARVVTFANGLVAREVLVTLDEDRRRLAYSAAGGRLTHHNAAFEVAEDRGGRSCVTWTADLLPDEMAGLVSGMMDDGAAAMKRTLEG
jgi:polyketide cyclase/dehydrase/lipid transport protein